MRHRLAELLRLGGNDAFLPIDIIDAAIRRVRELSGPTTLTVAEIEDGEYLQRVGRFIVGGPGGGGSTPVPETRAVNAGEGLSGGGTLDEDVTLDVNVDGVTIEIVGDTLRLAGPHTLNVVLDAGDTVLSEGVKCDVVLERNYTIESWTLVADVAGDLVVDVWRDVFASFPPTVADSITGSAPPELIGQDAARDTSLVGWTVDVDAGDVLRFNVDSVSAISRVTLSLRLLPR